MCYVVRCEMDNALKPETRKIRPRGDFGNGGKLLSWNTLDHVGSGSSPAIRPAAPATQQEPGGLAGHVSGYMK